MMINALPPVDPATGRANRRLGGALALVALLIFALTLWLRS